MEVEGVLDDGELNMIFDNLDEWLNDEDRIITYRWLSLTLNLHVNYAKHALRAFIESERGKNQSLSVTYCLAGLTQTADTKVYRVMIVQDEDLKVAESTLLPPVTCHVYSIQKSKLKNSDVLHLADFDLIKSTTTCANKYSAIQCPAAVPCVRTAASGPAVNGTVLEPASKLKTSPATGPISQNKPTAATSKPPDKSTTSKNSSSTALGRMFQNASKKKVEPAVEVKNAGESRKTTDSGSKTDKLPSLMTEPETVTASNKAKATTVTSNDKASVHQKACRESKMSKAGNKRRRILQVSSSDDDEVASIESPSPEAPSSPAAVSAGDHSEPMDVAADGHQTNVAPSSEPQIMQRKLVSKTYVNEEGFMVTEKVWESEMIQKPPSTDENATTTVPTPASTAAPAQKKQEPEKKTSSRQNTAPAKQASLTRFFQKK